MIVEEIKLNNFRNYHQFDVSFVKGINFIYGANASGKTSLVEGIYYLSLARSFRTSRDQDLINNKSEFATINAKLSVGETKKEIMVYLSHEGKKIAINKKQIGKISELSNIVNAIYFIPKDVNLLRDSPKNRRLYLDVSISKVSKSYLEHVTNYEKLLRTRNGLLRKEKPNIDLIEVVTSQMIEISKEIYIYRKEYIEELNKKANQVFKEITNSELNIEIIYVPFINNKNNYVELAKQEFKNSLELDIKRKLTNKGVQKEDFKILLNKKDVSIYGSQGENRLAVLALKLAPYELIKDYKNKPIVILDDVLSELDKDNQKSLLTYLSKLSQVFITSTNKIEINNANYYFIDDGNTKKGA